MDIIPVREFGRSISLQQAIYISTAIKYKSIKTYISVRAIEKRREEYK